MRSTTTRSIRRRRLQLRKGQVNRLLGYALHCVVDDDCAVRNRRAGEALGALMGQNRLRAALAFSFLLAVGVVLNVVLWQAPPSELMRRTALTAIPALNPGLRATAPVSAPAPVVPRANAAIYQHGGKADPNLVRPIQRELYSRGYTRRAPDGVLDTATRAAILAWESDNGVRLSASPSERLLKALLLGASVDPVGVGMAPTAEAAALIRYVQGLLNEHNHGQLAATGRLDAATRAAIIAFEKANGLKSQGRVSEALVDKLQKRGRRS